jgi:hypothetical protein
MSTLHPATETDAKRAAKEERARQALEEQVRTLTARTKKLEQTIRLFTTSTTLSDTQRGELIGLLTGTHQGRFASTTQASNAVLKVVDCFLSMSGNRRRIFSGLAKELAEKGRS